MGKSYQEMVAAGLAEEEAARKSPEEQSKERFAKALAWARRELPEEHAPFAASAALTLKLGGQKVTAQAVRARLAAQGRDRKAVDERRRRYERSSP